MVFRLHEEQIFSVKQLPSVLLQQLYYKSQKSDSYEDPLVCKLTVLKITEVTSLCLSQVFLVS